MFMYTSSRGKSNRSHSKSEFQMFSLISGRHVGVPWEDINMASAYCPTSFPGPSPHSKWRVGETPGEGC